MILQITYQQGRINTALSYYSADEKHMRNDSEAIFKAV
jgi:hypothetical protein